MAYTTMTLAELKVRAEDLLDLDTDSDLNERTVIIAVNDYLRSYIPEEQRVFPADSRKETTVSIDDNGYDLSLITDLGSTKVGFRVYYKNAQGQRLLEVRQDSQRFGYYIQDGKLYIMPSPSQSNEYFIQYMPTITQFDTTNLPTFATTLLPVRIGAEKGAEYMVASRYTERDQAEPQKAENYMTKSLESISTFFATHAGVATYSTR